MNRPWIVALILLQSVLCSDCFQQTLSRTRKPTARHEIDPSLPIFDGSSIDPVVVSNSFWASIQTRLVSVFVGQALALVGFGALSQSAAFISTILGDKRTPAPPPAAQSNQQIRMRNPDFSKLAICLAIDIVRSSNELVPIIGEVTDIVWAPIAATLLRNLYGGSNAIFALEFAEEILPFTDVLPLATICWMIDTLAPASGAAQFLELGFYRKEES